MRAAAFLAGTAVGCIVLMVVINAAGRDRVESRIAVLEACLSGDMPPETSPDPCFQIREAIKRDQHARSLSAVSLGLTRRVDESARLLDGACLRVETQRVESGWVRAALARLFGRVRRWSIGGD